jgi:CheY-like chemotaxis protein
MIDSKNKKIIIINLEGSKKTLSNVSDKETIVNRYSDAIKLLENDNFDHIVMSYNLLDQDCRDFIELIQQTSSYNPSLIVSAEDLESNKPIEKNNINQEDVEKVMDLIRNAEIYEVQKKFQEIPFVKLKPNQQIGTKSYIFSFELETLMIGIRSKSISELPNFIEVIIQNNNHEICIKLNGLFEMSESFDNDEDDIVYTSFLIGKEQDLEEWSSFVESHKQHSDELRSYLISNI